MICKYASLVENLKAMDSSADALKLKYNIRFAEARIHDIVVEMM